MVYMHYEVTQVITMVV